jgi:hypothetical protein
MLRIVAFLFASAAVQAAEMFPFTLPWDDASESATNVSWLNDKPAGRDGFVRVKDGHLFTGEKRLRIFGVNVCFGANFPRHEDAEKVAARMAKFGINCVRFHHMDMFSAPNGIFAKDGRTLDAGQLDKLDFFIAKLKEHGIYADLNLHVSRTYPDRPREEKRGLPDYDKGVDNFHAPMIALQRDYARDLLTHVNKYTGKAYAEEPAVALVEINNENALGFQWWAGQMDDLPQPYADDLAAQWTAWLVKKYGALEKAAWSEGAREAGAELIAAGSAGVPPAGSGVSPEPSSVEKTPKRDTPSANERKPTPDGPRETRGPAGGTPALPDARASRAAWTFENHGEARAKGLEKDGAITFTVEKAGAEAWHAQFSAAPLSVAKDETYEGRFRVRVSRDVNGKAPKDVNISVALMQAHEPWKVLGSASVKAGAEWRDVSALVRTNDADANARLTIGGMGQTVGAFEFAGISLRTAAVRGAPVVEGKNARYIRKSGLGRYTQAAQRDWQEFIWDTETAYWNGMRDFLKKELGVKAPIVGTQGFWSPGHVQAGMDVIDSHAYWHHPDFHGRGWNADVWDVKNEPMAGAPDGGTLPGLAAQRVAGKPFLCTEYNHPAPNTYSAETFPLLCAFAALQDWDGVFAFSYSHRAGDAWAQDYFNNFFDIDRHTVKMATLPGAVISFRRGDVWQAESSQQTHYSQHELVNEALANGPGFATRGKRGSERTPDFAWYRYSYDVVDASRTLVSDVMKATSTLHWDGQKKFATTATKGSQLFVGAIEADRTVQLGEPLRLLSAPKAEGAKLTLGATSQNWACYQLTVLDRDERADFSTAERILITATGDIENTGMGWKNAEKTSVGRDWGKAPVLVEGPAAKIELPGGGKLKAWALDERGHRRAEIPVTNGTLEIGPQHRTLWYEVVRE